MRSLLVSRLGESPIMTDLPTPEPGPGEVRLRIAACGLNFADLLMIEGRYQEKPALPYVPGMEIAGTVDRLGPGVTGLAPGARVAVIAGQGGLAETGCFAADRCIPLPEAMPFETAAAFPIAYGTSHLALDRRAVLRPGETLLVTGAAGGVGLTAVEIGKLMGARVIAVARGADKLAVAAAAGADHLIDSGSADLKAELKALGGVDVAYETIGGDIFEAAMGAMRPEGRMLAIGFAGGTVPQVATNRLLVKNLSVIGLYWGGYLNFRPEVLRDSLAQLFAWYGAGRLKPHVSHVLPLSQADQALALLRERRSTGKVVVRCGASE
ncbi:NADPH:quinone oxidoreductase family protein [Frigidibacter sp. RF13]|uniref:NADPH:quinone oxidoreductase family protein n=1 Tax=Frigidibacter sp. RF13 TaxID=2997340 RepID=UPI002271FD92|nr:NADPH:quinone oxidoreductase family protein [Frigidibacter sp. RF13]MCY1127309.1 NADPH:quinone oxidoreductase family protein [Frigidibacter sp. RF13]